MANALQAYRAIPLPSQGARATRAFFVANNNYRRMAFDLGLPLDTAGSARFLPVGAARLWWPLLAGVLLTEGLDAWARYAYPGDEGAGFYIPSGWDLRSDGGPHGPSVLFHNNESTRNAFYSVAADPGDIHGHGQSPLTATIADPNINPAHRFLRYVEGCGLFSPNQGWYNRAVFTLHPSLSSSPTVNGNPLRVVDIAAQFALAPLPWYYPALDPFALPIAQPVPAPRPLPLHFPVRVPVGDPLGEPSPAPRPEPKPGTVRVPVPVPGVVTVPAMEAVPGQAARPVRHELRPPRNGEKEGKGRVGGRAAGVTWALANLITESLDLLNAMWWALPKQFRTPWASPLEKAMDVFNFVTSWALGTRDSSFHAARTGRHRWGVNRASGVPSDADFGSWFVDAFKNVTVNEVQDRLIGQLARGANQLTKNPYYRRPVGVTAGPWDRPPAPNLGG